MNKLLVCVCKNMEAEIGAVLRQEQYPDVELVSFSCLCLSKSEKSNVEHQLQEVAAQPADRLLLCSKQCETAKLTTDRQLDYQVVMNESCLGYLLPKQLLQYITENGGYAVSAGWLKNWRANLAAAGFDAKTAPQFYHEFCSELVFVDSGLMADLQPELLLLASYLDLPCRTIPIGSERIRTQLHSRVLEWRFRQKITESETTIRKLQRENAEYAALLHMMKGISLLSKKREVIDRIKEIFLLILGAQKFSYTESLQALPPEFAGAEQLLAEPGPAVVPLPNGKGLLAAVIGKAGVFGLIQANEFMFPQYLERYLTVVPGLLQICSVVLQNVHYLESIEQQKQHLQHVSSHDALTQLYNRGYFEDFIAKAQASTSWAIFMCDLDGMKQINDVYGHAAGDEALGLAADALRQSFRETDVIARVGGDEFAVVVMNCDEKLAATLQQRLQAAVDSRNQDSRPWKLRISCGYAIAGGELVDADRLSREIRPTNVSGETALQGGDAPRRGDVRLSRRWMRRHEKSMCQHC